MTDILVRHIPLPLPRPMLEETIPGASNAGIDWNIPLPEMADIDLSFPMIGMNWILQPWNNFRQGWYEFVFYPWTEYVFFGGVLVAVGAVAGGLELLLRKIWKI